MNRITKLFGSLMISAAVLTPVSAVSFADTAVNNVQPAAPSITGFSVEITDDGALLTWNKVQSERSIFIFRKTDASITCAAVVSPETVSYLDGSLPDEKCVYFLQTDVEVNGVPVVCSSNKITVFDDDEVGDIEEVDDSTVDNSNSGDEICEKMNAGLTIGNGKAVVSWNKTAASGYIVTMDGKDVYDTKSGDVTSYTASVANYSKHTFTVRAYSDGKVIEESAPMVTTSIDTILNSARTSETRSFTITNKQSAANSVSVSKLSDHDIAVLEKFAAEHFTADMTDAEKIQYTLTWVNRNVRYASTSADWALIGNKSFADAIFTYRCGQCAQYNGAVVSMMRYLGYDADMILAWRGNSWSRWQHYWGEVEVDGLRFIIEAGNYGSSGTWSYLLLPYSRTDNRFIMFG